MILSVRTRFLAALVVILLALGSSMSAARADAGPHDLTSVPSPTTSSGDDNADPYDPDLARSMAGGNVRRYSDGQVVTYRMKVGQTIQPKGPQIADLQSSSMDLLLTETVKEDDDGPLVTLEVTEAKAEGFLAEAEEASALKRKVQFRPGDKDIQLIVKNTEDGKPDLLNPETQAPFGELGTIRMVDIALRAHLLNPVIPSADYAGDDSFVDTATLPAGWALGFVAVDGSTTIVGPEVQDGRDVLRVKGVHVTGDTLLRVRAMDNAREALQGNEKPVPNDFFAGTVFNALFPKGSTYESLMPKLPLQGPPAARRRKLVRNRPRRGVHLLMGCLMLLGLASCGDPSRNVDVVSLNLSGPMQIDHNAVIDAETGVVLSSQVEAAARLTGAVYAIPESVMPLIPPHLRTLSNAEVAMDVDWTITEEIEGEVPEPAGLFNSENSGTLVIAGAVVLGLGLVVIFMLARKKRKSGAAPAEADPPSPSP